MLHKRVSFFAKDKPGVDEAIVFLKDNFRDVVVFKGSVGDPFPEAAYENVADLSISYISPWIIPGAVLKNTREFSMNFHPGPPEYPGIGCTNFALYDNADEFGVTAHIMEEKVDTGEIIDVRRFEILSTDTVYSLTQRCYANISVQFRDVMDQYIRTGTLKITDDRWARRPYTRKELNDLCVLTLDMSEAEMRRRIRAVDYPGMPGAYIEIYRIRFIYER